MVTPPPRPRAGVGERGAVGPGARTTPATAAALVVLVVAELEEPDQPDDQRADVEDAQSDHEDPSGQRHLRGEPNAVARL